MSILTRSFGRLIHVPMMVAALFGFWCGTATAQSSGGFDVLNIGSSGTLDKDGSKVDAKVANDILRVLVKSETGFNNKIVAEKGWKELADSLASGKNQIGIYPGFEFAWAKARDPKLHALAIAVNHRPFIQEYLVVRKKGAIERFADLKGQKISMSTTRVAYQNFFVRHLTRADGKTEPNEFFSKIQYSSNVEDALDDLVDGLVQAVAVERNGLEAYKRRKPGRFKQLRMLAHSNELPPTVVAYYDGKLDSATLQRFKDGLLNANQHEKGRTTLTHFKLTGFLTPPSDFETVLTRTCEAYPVLSDSER